MLQKKYIKSIDEGCTYTVKVYLYTPYSQMADTREKTGA